MTRTGPTPSSRTSSAKWDCRNKVCHRSVPQTLLTSRGTAKDSVRVRTALRCGRIRAELSAGTTLGPYEILSSIGAGGMGQVYKARDSRLNRPVAIKVLSHQVSNISDLKQRFEREAQTVAALNHPHICTLHDVGSDRGIDYLVMEYLEGETVAQRLERGPLPLDQILKYSIQVADALDKAHRQGVTPCSSRLLNPA